jgi:hypothetical protein
MTCFVLRFERVSLHCGNVKQRLEMSALVPKMYKEGKKISTYDMFSN